MEEFLKGRVGRNFKGRVGRNYKGRVGRSFPGRVGGNFLEGGLRLGIIDWLGLALRLEGGKSDRGRKDASRCTGE